LTQALRDAFTASLNVVGLGLVHWNANFMHLVEAQQHGEKLCCACTTFRLSVSILLGCVCCSCAAEAASGKVYYEDYAYKLATNGRKV